MTVWGWDGLAMVWGVWARVCLPHHPRGEVIFLVLEMASNRSLDTLDCLEGSLGLAGRYPLLLPAVLLHRQKPDWPLHLDAL